VGKMEGSSKVILMLATAILAFIECLQDPPASLIMMGRVRALKSASPGFKSW
jgi:hypothetical protein